MAFPGKTVLQFDYSVIQLNRLSWRDFVDKVNPVAALMAKMKIEAQDRPRVLIQCIRMLATLKLDPARSELVWTFAESYLKLTPEETKQYEREFASLAAEEQETAMQMISSFRREGRHEGQERTIVRMIGKRFGTVASDVTGRLSTLSTDQLDALTDALLDFKTVADLEAWLSRQ